MKYEEWIKYEKTRKRQSAPICWVTLPVPPKKFLTETLNPKHQHPKRPPWTWIVQIFSLLSF